MELLHQFLFVAKLTSKHVQTEAPSSGTAQSSGTQWLQRRPQRLSEAHTRGVRRLDFEVAETDIKVLKRHLWYLRPKVVVFSLFGEQFSLDEKAEMSRRLLATPRHYDEECSPSAVVLDDI